jgi:DNA invertase Pin-like site-specific DNA recombinase
MMSAAESGSFDTLLCWKVDRFGRNREESALFKGRLRRFGVKVLYAMEPIPEGSAGVLLEGMLEATAEWYSRQLSENVTRGMNDNARRCLYNGTRILGYTRGADGRYAIQPDEAAVVRFIFERYCAGYSAARICSDLNSRGVLTSRRKWFRPESVLRAINNERYTGVYIWGDIRVPGGMPAIIERTVWEEAQRMKTKTARHVEQGAMDYLLTGRAFCGHCGAAMIGDSGTSKAGVRHYYYSCQSKKARTGCTKKSVRKDALEDIVVNYILDYCLTDAEMDRIADLVQQEVENRQKHSRLAALEKELAEVEKKLKNIADAICNGVWGPTTQETMHNLEEDAAALRKEIAKEKFNEIIPLDRDQVLFILHKFASIDRHSEADRRLLINAFLNSVYVYDDHLKIILNTIEGQPRLMFDEVPDIPLDDSSGFAEGVLFVTQSNTILFVFVTRMERGC